MNNVDKLRTALDLVMDSRGVIRMASIGVGTNKTPKQVSDDLDGVLIDLHKAVNSITAVLASN